MGQCLLGHSSLTLEAPPIGLAGNMRLKRAVAFDDVELRDYTDMAGLRREMEGGARQAAVA